MRQSLAPRLRATDSADVAGTLASRGSVLPPSVPSGQVEVLSRAGSFAFPREVDKAGKERDQDLESKRGSETSVANGPDSRTVSGERPASAGAAAAGQRRLIAVLAPWKRRTLGVLNHINFTWLLVFLTFFIIFEDDFKKACLPQSADLPLEITITVIFVLFVLEMALSSFLRPGYFLGFYFWLDAIATCSLVFEVPTVRAKFFRESDYINLADSGGFVDNAGDQLYISSKAGRVARIFRLLRMLRLHGLYSQYVRRRRIKQALEAAGASAVAADAEQLSILEFEMQQEEDRKTKVGTKLEELTNRRIIVGVLVMFLLVPAFDVRLGTFGRPQRVGEGGLRMLHVMAIRDGQDTDTFQAALQTFNESVLFHVGTQLTGEIYGLKIANKIITPVGPERRFEELYSMSYTSYKCNNGTLAGEIVDFCDQCGGLIGGTDAVFSCDMYDTFAVYDWRWYSRITAVLNIARSLFIIVLLVLGAYFLNRDSRNLVLLPIERMVQRVQELSENPLAMAESRLHLQAPWHDKLKLLQETNRPAVPRDSIVTAVGPASSSRDSVHHPHLGLGGIGAVSMGGGGGVADRAAALHHQLTFLESSKRLSAMSTDGFGRSSVLRSLGTELAASLAVAAVTNASSSGGPAAAAIAAARASTMERNTSMADRHPRLTAFRVRVWMMWVRARQFLETFFTRVWTYLWDGTPEEEDAHTGNGTGAGAYETEILENSLAKIGALLAIGFGDAGAEVIAENIRNDGDINPMVPGRKTVAIFGFCDIRSFTDTTEVLQEDVMEFVNSIAHIVHTSVSTHGGSPNKNIGDAFLLVWKFPRGFRMRDINNVTRDRRDASRVPERHLKPMAESMPPIPAPIGGDTGPGAMRSASSPGSSSLPTATATITTGANPTPSGLSASPNTSGSGVPPPPAGAANTNTSTAPTLGGLSAAPSKRRFLSLPSSVNRVAPLPPGDNQLGALLGGAGGGGGGPHPHPHLHPNRHTSLSGIKASSSLAHTLSLAQLADEGFGLGNTEGHPHGPLTNKMTVIKALMALKHDVEMSWEAKRGVINAIADNALASFVLIHVALKRSARLKKYAMRKDLNRRMPGFTIAMGFGLHVGWAIEGAIGSEYKIDASYLSPNVNMASRLEAATKQFGVSLLLSGDFVECLSSDVRAKVRQIDCVTVKGSIQPMGLYTYDICLDAVPEPTQEQIDSGDDSHVEEMLWQSYLCGNEWHDNPELTSCWGVDADFKEEFDKGFHAYRVGNWGEAQRRLEVCRTAMTGPMGLPRVDGPSDVLLKFMAEYSYTAPPNWRGFRELTEK